MKKYDKRNVSRHLEKAIVLPVHKKREQTAQEKTITYIVSAYLWEKVIFDAIYEHLTDNQFLTPNQFGFCLGDSTVNQLLHVTHRICAAFEDFPLCETRAVFLDISKAFDKVWHDGQILKLKSYGILGPLLTLTESYLSNRKQRIVLDGKCSEWSSITAGVPQGSTLGPLFFLIYINDLVDDLSSDAKLFPDDTSLFTIVYDEIIAAEQLNNYLKIISEWAYQWKMQFNPDKSKQVVQVIFLKRGLSQLPSTLL